MTDLACVPVERIPLGELVSPGERLFWSAERHGTAAPPFVECPRHLPIVLHLSNRLDVAALRSALAEIVRRHEPLRSTFHDTARGLVRVPHASGEWPESGGVETVADADARQVTCLLREELERPFDLEKGPPLRARLLRVGEEEHVLSIVVHHIVFDGWSVGVLLRELGLLYAGYTTGAAPALPDLRADYASYVARQRARLESDDARRAVEYWRQRLRGAAAVSFAPRSGAGACPPSAAERFTIDAERTARLRRLGQEHRFTFAVVLATLFKRLLQRRTGASDLVVGMPVVDRPLAPYEDLIGLFLNMVLLRTDLGGAADTIEALGRVRDTFRGAYLHGHLPYAVLCQRLPEAERLPRVVFNLMNFRRVPAELPGLVVRHVPVEARLPSLADLSLHLGETDGGLGGRFIYRTSLFTQDDVREMSRELSALVDEALLRHGRGAID